MTISRDVIVARSETLNNHIAWERFLISRFFARPEAVHEICGLQSGRDHIPWADESAMELVLPAKFRLKESLCMKGRVQNPLTGGSGGVRYLHILETATYSLLK